MNEECKHEWIASNVIYCSYPPQWDEICKYCGKIERRRGKRHNLNEYCKIYNKFHGRKERTGF